MVVQSLSFMVSLAAVFTVLVGGKNKSACLVLQDRSSAPEPLNGSAGVQTPTFF